MGKISRNITENKEYIKNRFSVPKNFDFVLREFEVKFADGYASAFLIFYDGMSDKTYINRDIMRNLLGGIDKPLSCNRVDAIYKKMTPVGPLTQCVCGKHTCCMQGTVFTKAKSCHILRCNAFFL